MKDANNEIEMKDDNEPKKETPKKNNVPKKTKVKKKLTKDTIVKVISNITGKLIYVSPNGMISFEIGDYGDYEYVELGTLLAIRNANRRFFEENWIIVDDGDDYTASEVYSFLRVDDYYKNVFSPENIDKLFNLEPNEIEKIISNYSNSLKQTIYIVAKEKYKNGELQYVPKIKAIEKAVELKLDEE